MTPLLLGHRGTPRTHIENTMRGFQAALDAGLDGAELDVRRLKDGTLVIHHDEHLKDGRALPQLVAADLPDYVPTLEQLLTWAAKTGAYLNVEIKYEKARPDDRVSRTLDAIRMHGLTKQVILSSFNPLILDAARRHAPEVKRGFLYHRSYKFGPLDLVPLMLRWLKADAAHPHHSMIDAGLMAQARAGGWQVNTWTVNNPAEVIRLSALGVNALIGDLPDVLLVSR
ncbi:glycerophosphodiester phosphodiesterase [Deinococcus arenicola]|uniref:Glycerophosphodiester phosphodiesterase n=1 Tax=Deinococcus arenicola TaxID=2994950 RepID=A0ABU4DTL0_9DEIO|nr:glycerophosphodiester phosphodiesterase [Deinococcus sp. ZS9-10]MDV6375774.1 glycerophosphodiester phosphodiesterase [Deinococcus sp. ZS9-10]